MKISKETYETLSELNTALIDAEGREVLNPRPMFQDVTPKTQSMSERIRETIRLELSLQAQEQGHESFEESQDFDVEDEFDMEEKTSEYNLAEEEFPIMKEEPISSISDPKITDDEIPSPEEENPVKETVSKENTEEKK